MVYAIVIATKSDGTKEAVGGPQPPSKAKATLAGLTGEGLKTAELFELRRPRKRRKFKAAPAATTPTPLEGAPPDGGKPSAATIAQVLVDNPSLIPDDGYTADNKPKVEVLGSIFNAEFSAAERDEIWEQVQKLSE